MKTKYCLIFLCKFFFSKFKKLILNIPSSCNENIIIIIPATILNCWEFWSKNFPSTDAVAPKIINTNENPKENNINGSKFIFLFSNNSFNDCPDINEI